MSEPIIKELLTILPQQGEVVSITVRPKRKADPEYREEVTAEQGSGLSEDHFSSRSTKREVTLIQAEHLDAVSSILGKEAPHHLTRRNILVKGINLLALKGQQFQIGEAVLEGTGECHPCSRMEENFGPGGYNTMRGHGGLTAKIIQSGRIVVGDSVVKI
jgi:MOSC domain-containing protein YiiM